MITFSHGIHALRDFRLEQNRICALAILALGFLVHRLLKGEKKKFVLKEEIKNHEEIITSVQNLNIK